MKYDFSEMTNRFGTNSYKWDVEQDELPMWVADMDFKTAPEIVAAIQNKVATGIFGYTIVPDQWYDAYIKWWDRMHDFKIEKDWLIFTTGVVPAISSTVRKLTTPAENVVIQTPVYNIFFNSILNNGRNVLENKLIYDGEGYSIDFEDLEEKLANPQTTLMILCNPHNPIGKVWDRETLAKIGEMAAKNNVLVLSDEIHCDLAEKGHDYIPFASVSNTCANNSITCIAPTKTFNLAGLQTAAAVIPNPVIRHKFNRGINTDEVAEPNAFAMEATIAAFEQGEQWLSQLKDYLKENKTTVANFLAENLPELHLVPSTATYLLWVDFSKVSDDTSALCREIRENTGLYLSQGASFGENGKTFIRINIACPRDRLMDGLDRLKTAINQYGK